MIFPGFDPYLEQQPYWGNFHTGFGVVLAEKLNENLPEDYEALVEWRIESGWFFDDFVEEFRGVSVNICRFTDDKIATIIEILSPISKNNPRSEYLRKRQNILESDVNLIEIDLLRTGESMPSLTEVPQSHYSVMVSAAIKRPKATLWVFNLQDSLPTISIPLFPKDGEIALDLQEAFQTFYGRTRYRRTLPYTENPPGRLSDADLVWVKDQLKKAEISPKF